MAGRSVFWTVVAVLLMAATTAYGDTWRGTAPFCEGKCAAGETAVGFSDYGDGAYCVTGKKVLCRNRNQQCNATSTQTSCYGVVMVCENGYHERPNQVWRGCNSYACGVCLGIGSIGILSTGTGGGVGLTAIPCKSGFVWREAFAGDYVCVPPAVRSQAAADNAAAASRRQPGGGASGPNTCKSGFVWREARPNDLVCVTPAVRSQTAGENAAAGERAALPRKIVNDRCRSGFVWREAVRDDHVCVTPATRDQAWQDNAQAAQRREAGNDRCKAGFVWREVIPADHVCVTPAVRSAAANDTALASTRLAGN